MLKENILSAVSLTELNIDVHRALHGPLPNSTLPYFASCLFVCLHHATLVQGTIASLIQYYVLKINSCFFVVMASDGFCPWIKSYAAPCLIYLYLSNGQHTVLKLVNYVKYCTMVHTRCDMQCHQTVVLTEVASYWS